MRLPLFIAYRYLFSKKKINAINIINIIAVVGFGVGAAAMIIVLSAFNGFEVLVGDMINTYDPDLRINMHEAKTFTVDDRLNRLKDMDGVESITAVLEDKVVVKYNDHQEIARIKGVDEHFDGDLFDSLIIMGGFDLGDTSNPLGVFGVGLASKLSLFPGSQGIVSVYVPNRNVEFNNMNPQAALSASYLRSSAAFQVYEEIDNEVFITSLEFAQELLSYPNEVSALEVKLSPGTDAEEVRDQMAAVLGDAFVIKTQRELNELIYKIFRSEKWFTFAILALVLVISSFNIFGSLIMLVLDKKKDIGVLKSMGATIPAIRKVFLWQGSYIALLGGVVGLLLGLILLWLQLEFGLIAMENSIVEQYPVDVRLADVLLTFVTVAILGYLISIYPANKAANTAIKELN